MTVRIVQKSYVPACLGIALSACVSPSPHKPTSTPVQVDPYHPARVGPQYYPEVSKRLGEQGNCKVNLTVGPDGSVRSAELLKSTGYSRLDQACLLAYRAERFIAATDHGKNVVGTIQMPITWKLDPP